MLKKGGGKRERKTFLSFISLAKSFKERQHFTSLYASQFKANQNIVELLEKHDAQI